MNPFERFFKLLYSIMGMVMSGATRIEWLNDCFQRIVDSPRGEEVPEVPPRLPSTFQRKEAGKRRKRVVLTGNLTDEHWEELESVTVHGDPRFHKIVTHFKGSGNVALGLKAMEKEGLLPGSIQWYSLLDQFNAFLLDYCPQYAFRKAEPYSVRPRMFKFFLMRAKESA